MNVISQSSNDSRQPAPSVRSPHPRWLPWAVFFAMYGPIVGVLLFRPAKWAMVESAQLVHFIGRGAGVLLLIAIIAHIWLHRSERAPESTTSQSQKRRRTRIRTKCLVAGSAAILVGGETIVHIAAVDIHDHLARQFPGVHEFYANGDIAELVGRTIEVSLLKVSEDPGLAKDRRSLQAVASVVSEAWVEMVDREPERVAALMEPSLVDFIADPSRSGFDRSEWVGLLEEWRQRADASPLTGHGKEVVADHLVQHFALSLREALKHDYELDGRSWAAVQLDIARRLLESSAAAASDTQEILHALAVLLSDTHSLRDLTERVQADQSSTRGELLTLLKEVIDHLRTVTAAVPLTVERLRLVHSRWDKHEELILEHADITAVQRDVSAGDSLQLVVHLSRPAFCRLLVLDTDGDRRWYPAGDSPAASQPILTLTYPQSTTEDKAAYYDITTGPGLQALVVLATDQRQSLTGVRADLDELLVWPAAFRGNRSAIAGTGWYVGDGAVIPLHTLRTGDVVHRPGALPSPVSDLARWLESLDGFPVAAAVVLDVAARNDSVGE